MTCAHRRDGSVLHVQRHVDPVAVIQVRRTNCDASLPEMLSHEGPRFTWLVPQVANRARRNPRWAKVNAREGTPSRCPAMRQPTAG